MPLVRPASLGGVQFRRGRIKFHLDFLDLFLQPFLAPLLFPGRQAEEGLRVGAVAVHDRLIQIVEQGVEAVILALLDGVVLMGVAAGASHRETEPDRAGCLDTVEGVFALVFLLDGPALAGAHIAADVTGSDFLLGACVGQQVACQLLSGEFVERHVLVERIDDPLAILPDAAIGVDVVAVRVGVAGGIQPVTRLMLAVTGRVEQPVHQPLIGLGLRVGQERVHLLRCWRQTGQIEGRPPDQRGFISFGGRLQSLFLQTRQDEVINLIARPFPVLHCGQWRTFRFNERPVALPFRPLENPSLQQINLRRCQLLAALRRGHQIVFIPSGDARDQVALFRLARQKRVAA